MSHRMKIGIAGVGAVGAAVARALDRGDIPGCSLIAFSASSAEKAIAFQNALKTPVLSASLEDLALRADIVLEALPPSLFDRVAIPVLSVGKTLIAMSASQMLDRQDLIELGARNGGRIIVPSGAILGIDAIKAAAVGTLHEVKITTRKPPSSLAAAPYVIRNNMTLHQLGEAVCVLKGTVREVAKEFPANVNVAAAISLAGFGPDRTLMEIWADPSLQLNTHTVSVKSDSSNFSMSIQNTPSFENPATGLITPQSVIALLRQMSAVVQLGT
ncbi:aspartate dehydrogenase [Mesorhizobium sp. Cs1321R2N1]|uniref:aspartate dehydrogenase n=1 Tax=Mesorhizobium sp. Cs1321R2N1 TaxID=3015174 RepID=UPI00301BA16A